MSAREEAKSRRKADILACAQSLLGKADGGGFSMRALAESAGVSSATPYNLFGSKHAILVAILDANLATYQSALSRLPAEGIDRIFAAINLMKQFLEREPGFYQNVMGELGKDNGTQLRQVISGPRYALWKNMLTDATRKGLLIDDLDPDAMAITCSQIIAANMREWAIGQLSLEEMDARIRYGLALLLMAIATDASRESLRCRWRDAERDLQSLWRTLLRERLQQGTLSKESKELLADQLKFIELERVKEVAL